MASSWKKERINLGVDSDAEIARRLGVSRERVRQVRTELGIPAPPRRLNRPAREVGSEDIISCLNAVPLSASYRQFLTDTRIEKGWSQQQLADKLGSGLSTIHSIEAGRKSPSPAFFSRLCEALGLAWRIEYQLKVFKSRRSGR